MNKRPKKTTRTTPKKSAGTPDEFMSAKEYDAALEFIKANPILYAAYWLGVRDACNAVATLFEGSWVAMSDTRRQLAVIQRPVEFYWSNGVGTAFRDAVKQPSACVRIVSMNLPTPIEEAL